MIILYTIIFFIFGTLMGSFLTVVGYRLPKKESFITTRSHCDSCGHVLALYEMIPVISFLIFGGRCNHCKEKISPLSTYNEIFTGVLFALAFNIFGFSYDLLLALGIVSLLIIIIVSDTTYLIIPNEVLIFFGVYFIIIQILNLGVTGVIMKIISGIIMFSVMYLIMIIGNGVLKKDCLGGGDIKMMFLFGILLEPFIGLISIFLASFLALPVSLFVLLKKKNNIIPFGPFLLLALTALFFSKITTSQILNLLQII